MYSIGGKEDLNGWSSHYSALCQTYYTFKKLTKMQIQTVWHLPSYQWQNTALLWSCWDPFLILLSNCNRVRGNPVIQNQVLQFSDNNPSFRKQPLKRITHFFTNCIICYIGDFAGCLCRALPFVSASYTRVLVNVLFWNMISGTRSQKKISAIRSEVCSLFQNCICETCVANRSAKRVRFMELFC